MTCARNLCRPSMNTIEQLNLQVPHKTWIFTTCVDLDVFKLIVSEVNAISQGSECISYCTDQFGALTFRRGTLTQRLFQMETSLDKACCCTGSPAVFLKSFFLGGCLRFASGNLCRPSSTF